MGATFKIITKQSKVFLYRLSKRMPDGGSYKIHVIVNDDIDGKHKHPWDFVSLMLIGAYMEDVDGVTERHRPLQIVRRNAHQHHQVRLYRFMGIKLPCVTVGRYTQKLAPWCEREVLCDMCIRDGACADRVYWSEQNGHGPVNGPQYDLK